MDHNLSQKCLENESLPNNSKSLESTNISSTNNENHLKSSNPSEHSKIPIMKKGNSDPQLLRDGPTEKENAKKQDSHNEKKQVDEVSLRFRSGRSISLTRMKTEDDEDEEDDVNHTTPSPKPSIPREPTRSVRSRKEEFESKSNKNVKEITKEKQIQCS